MSKGQKKGNSSQKPKAAPSSLKQVLIHLLKWQYQPQRRTKSWIDSITEHRRRLYQALERSPRLFEALRARFEWEYTKARRKAAQETGIQLSTFPRRPPFNLDQTLAFEWLPPE